MSNLSRTETKLTVDAAIARFINENPDDYATESDSFDVDDVPENCELVGPVSYERDILAGIVLARTLRQYRDTLQGYKDRVERQAAWGKEKIQQIRDLELIVSQRETYIEELEGERDGLLERVNELLAVSEDLENKYKDEIKARLDTQAKLNERNLDYNRAKTTVTDAANELDKINALLRTAIADTVRFITPHRTVADAYDDAEEVLPDPDLPLDIKVAKLPEETEIYTAEELAQPLHEDCQWVVDELRRLEPHLGGYATCTHHAKFAILEWCLSVAEKNLDELVIFLNGKKLYWDDMTKDQFLNLLDAIGAQPPKDDKEND